MCPWTSLNSPRTQVTIMWRARNSASVWPGSKVHAVMIREYSVDAAFRESSTLGTAGRVIALDHDQRRGDALQALSNSARSDTRGAVAYGPLGVLRLVALARHCEVGVHARRVALRRPDETRTQLWCISCPPGSCASECRELRSTMPDKHIRG